jgi:hypothetical protein
MPRPDISLTPDEQTQFLCDNRKCALATVDQHGFPHVVAMNFRERDGAYYMTSYGKAQKVLNIRRNPKVGIMVETGGAYAELKGVMVRGGHGLARRGPCRRASRRRSPQRPEARRTENHPAQDLHLGPLQARRPVLIPHSDPEKPCASRVEGFNARSSWAQAARKRRHPDTSCA